MGELISIETARTARALTIEEAWEEWRALNEKARTSERFEDALAAGKAWGRFLELFDRRAK
jgi:hypothetical protein